MKNEEKKVELELTKNEIELLIVGAQKMRNIYQEKMYDKMCLIPNTYKKFYEEECALIAKYKAILLKEFNEVF